MATARRNAVLAGGSSGNDHGPPVALFGCFGLIAAICGWAIASDTLDLLVLVPVVVAVALFSLFEGIPMSLLLTWLALGPVLVPFARFPSGSQAIFTFDRVALLGIAVMVFGSVTNLSRASRRTKEFLFWLSVLGVVVLIRALLGTVGPTHGLKFVLDSIVLPGAAFLIVRAAATDRRRIDQMLLAIGIGGAVAGAISIAQWVFGFSLAAMSGGVERFDHQAGVIRHSGPYSVPEVLSIVLLCAIAATLCWARRGSDRWIPAGAMVAVQFIGIYLSYFRTGWVTAALVLVGSLVWGTRRNQRAMLAAAVLVGVGVIAYGQVSQGQSAVSTRLNNSANTYARIAAYEQGLRMIAQHPVIGVGLGGYPVVSSGMSPTWFDGRRNVDYPHNSLIQIGAEAGIFALLAAIGLAIAAVRLVVALWRRVSDGRDDALAVCGALVLAAYFLFGLPFSLIPYGYATTAVFAILALCSARLDTLSLPLPGRSTS